MKCIISKDEVKLRTGKFNPRNHKYTGDKFQSREEKNLYLYKCLEDYLARLGWFSNRNCDDGSEEDYYINDDFSGGRFLSMELINRKMESKYFLRYLWEWICKEEEDYFFFVSQDYEDASIENDDVDPYYFLVVTKEAIYCDISDPGQIDKFNIR